MKSALSIVIGILPLAVILAGVFPANSGATVLHSDGSAANVRSLHKSAQNGDTITLPAGNFNWDSQISITKAITLQGAGPGATNITSSYTEDRLWPLRVCPAKRQSFGILPWAIHRPLIAFSMSPVPAFANIVLPIFLLVGAAIGRSGLAHPETGRRVRARYGVIDSCTWSGGRSGLFVRDNPNANPNSWNRPMTFGTEEGRVCRGLHVYRSITIPECEHRHGWG